MCVYIARVAVGLQMLEYDNVHLFFNGKTAIHEHTHMKKMCIQTHMQTHDWKYLK